MPYFEILSVFDEIFCTLLFYYMIKELISNHLKKIESFVARSVQPNLNGVIMSLPMKEDMTKCCFSTIVTI